MSVRVAGMLVLAVTLIGPANLCAQAVQAQQAPPSKPDTQDPGKPTLEALGVSLDRVKTALDQSEAPPLKISQDQPTFKVQVVEKRRSWVPDYRESLKFPWEPIPSGGRDNYELMNMITPPEARPYGAFNSGELAQVVATSIVSALIMSGLQRAGGYFRDAYRARLEEEAKDQVRRELEDFLFAHPDAPRPAWWTGTIR